MLTAQAGKDFNDFLNDIIAYANVTVNGTASKMPIHRREYMNDGRYAVYINITPNGGSTAKITRVQLYNKNQQLWADKAVNIEIKSVQEGALYRFVFKITEQEV